MRILRNVCLADASGRVCASLGQQGAIVTFVAFAARPFSDAADEFDVKIRADVLLLIAALCEFDHHNKVCRRFSRLRELNESMQSLFGLDGITALQSYLTLKPELLNLNQTFQNLFAAAIICVWSVAVKIQAFLC